MKMKKVVKHKDITSASEGPCCKLFKTGMVLAEVPLWSRYSAMFRPSFLFAIGDQI